MTRLEHINDPDAPKATSIVVAATAFVLDHEQAVLLIRRSDNGLWALPGGALDLGESIADTAVRETYEESGIIIRVTGLVGIYSDPNHVIEYSDGEIRQQFSITFRAEPVGGSLQTSSESTEVGWVSQDDTQRLDINPSMRLRIQHGFAMRSVPYIG